MLQKGYGRRRFLQNAALFSAGAVSVSLVGSRRTRASSSNHVTAVVIGTGFGGAIAALRLGQAGIDTVVLERGRRWPITPDGNTFATFDRPDGRAAWLSSKTYFGQPIDVYTGVLETLAEDGISVLCGAGFGGGSLVYNCITYQPRPDIFYKVFPRSLINYDELAEVYYPRVRSMLQPTPIPQDILATNYYEKVQLFMEQATRAGFPNHLLDLAVDWNIVREEINGTKVPSTILGQHWWGINSGAKHSLDHNYLPQAEKTGFVEILTLHSVTAITKVTGQNYRVSCVQINKSGEVVEEKSFTCRYLFLAAGSMGTSKLLVKAKATGALPRLNDYVGQSWGSNGDLVVIRSNLPSAKNDGGPSGAVLERLDDTPYPHALMNLSVGYGDTEGRQQLLGVGIEPASGTFTYDASTDSVTLHWSPNQENQAYLLEVEKTLNTLDSRNPTSTGTPKTEVSATATAHPVGGAAMGQVCDAYGRVMGYRGLYVVDGALLPGGAAASTNPSFTIAALAERCMDRIIAEDIR